MKKFLLTAALILALVTSLTAGTMAAYTQKVETIKADIQTKTFSITADQNSGSFIQNLKIAPGDQFSYKVKVNNASEVRSDVDVAVALTKTYEGLTVSIDKTNNGNSILRPIHYPPITTDDIPNVRAGAHGDINFITLLVGASAAALEVQSHDGEWVPFTSDADTIVVNIGDMLQRLVNHVLPSTTHRVVNPAPERRGFARYSTPFFLHFNPDFPIETLPSTITPENPDRYAGKTILAEDFLTERLKEIRLI